MKDIENKFDYFKKYYKVTSENEIHNGFQYKDGLNTLVEEFNDNPEASCVPGGFYFTDYENLPKFFGYGEWIREVTIPTDAKVVLDPDGDKWRTDKIILGKKYSIKNDFSKWFKKEEFNYKYSYNLAQYCSNYIDEWFDADKFDWKDSEFLAQYCSNHFDKWFDKDKFNWNFSESLAIYCSDHFDKWFDAKKFDWSCSGDLARYCSKHFDKWFDPDKYDWEDSSWAIAKYCPEKMILKPKNI